MVRKGVGLQDVDGHVDAIGVEDQRRVTERRAPAGLDEPAADMALPPDTAERGELVWF